MSYGDLPASYDGWLTTEPEPRDAYEEQVAREDAILDRAGL